MPDWVPSQLSVRARILLLVMTLLLASCVSPAYYFQAAKGQWQIMHARQDISDLLADPDTPDELARQLNLVSKILTFAGRELDLDAEGSYQSYVDTKRNVLVWNVIAAPEFSLTAKRWCFAVAGCVPYRGYFSREKADKLAQDLTGKSLDVTISPASAYSTLGWFDDPVLNTMLRRNDAQLVAYLFHELAHKTFYLRGDTAFNEGFARFVEQYGVLIWLENHQQLDEAVQWHAARNAASDFNQLVLRYRQQLTALYTSTAGEQRMRQDKQIILAELRSDYDQMVDHNWNGENYFSAWFNTPLNNAKIALMNSYEGGHCAFSDLMAQAENNMNKFHSLVQIQAKLSDTSRSAWLNQSCDQSDQQHRSSP